ncbi:MAG: DMT family transporter [Patescibacteria group bacterium]
MKRFAPYVIVFAAFLWSTDALIRLPLTGHVPSQVIVFYEHLFGVVLLLPVLFLKLSEFRNLNRKDWMAILCIGVGGSALATLFFTQSFLYVSPSVSILLQKVQPLLAISLAALLLKERLNKHFLLWAFVAIVGAFFVSFPDGHINFSLSDSRGIYLALAAAFFWGASTVFGRMVVTKISFAALTVIRLLVALMFITVLMTTQRTLASLGDVSSGDVWSLILITLVPGTGALLLYYGGLRHTKASIATIAELFFPFAAVILNWFFLDQTLVVPQIIGGAVLLFGIYQVQKHNRASHG